MYYALKSVLIKKIALRQTLKLTGFSAKKDKNGQPSHHKILSFFYSICFY